MRYGAAADFGGNRNTSRRQMYDTAIIIKIRVYSNVIRKRKTIHAAGPAGVFFSIFLFSWG